MRLQAEKKLNSFPNFSSADGTSENTNLSEKTIDLITAAQAFHWYTIHST